ncbi:MAG TPA: diguanylate cyclase [Xanthomonadaceae bacterium]|nr:diguanylate cyclase [Xanthomonadaceae bacterium]
MARARVVVLLALLLGLLPAAAAQPLKLSSGTDYVTAMPHAWQLLDPDGEMGLEQVRLAAVDGRMQPVQRTAGNFGFVDGALWLQVPVVNTDHSESRWLLVVDYALVDHIALYVIGGDQVLDERHSGDRTPFATRDLDLREFNFLVELPAGERRDLWLRFASESSMQVPLVLATPAAFLERRQSVQIKIGLFYGIIFALLAYNLVLYVSVRDRTFLWYVCYAASMLAMLLTLNGLAFQYLWPRSPDFANLAVLLSIAVTAVLIVQFARVFLELRTHFPAGDLLMRWLMVAAAALGAAGFFLPYGLVVAAETWFALLVAPAILVCAIACLRRYRPARFFLLAWTMLLIGTVVYASVSLGLLPKMFLTEYAMQLGASAEMILLSFALAYRLNLLKAENVRIQHEASARLAERVEERTRDLASALARLEDANRQLQDYSRRDGLTGAYNRRHFEVLLRQHLAQAAAHGQPLSLLMIDVDHFKPINDRYGHLLGDDCLRAMANACTQLLALSQGVFARYGGEEFAVLLPGYTADAAVDLAEKLRREVAAQRVVSNGDSIALTISVGVAEQVPDGPPGNGEADALVSAADAALYRAKSLGRNCVVRADEDLDPPSLADQPG